MENLSETVVRLDENQKTIFKRLDTLELQSQATFELAAAMREMNKRMERMENKLDTIEREPVETSKQNRRAFMAAVISSAVSAIVGTFLGIIIHSAL